MTAPYDRLVELDCREQQLLAQERIEELEALGREREALVATLTARPPKPRRPCARQPSSRPRPRPR